MTRLARRVLIASGLAGLLACGSSTTGPAAATEGGENTHVTDGVVALPGQAPPPAVELAPEQASANPAPAAVALGAMTSPAEPMAEVVDPVRVSPAVYKIVVESTRMRMLLATWQPGQSDAPHGHPPLVVYALSDIDGLVTGNTGMQKRIKLKQGAAFYQNPEKSHSFQNTGKKPARLLLLELSQRVDPLPMPKGAAPDALIAAPHVYKRVFEDEHVRVLLGTWQPGTMDKMHSHPELAAFAITATDAKLHDDDGATRDLKKPGGGAVFQDPVRGHIYENVGTELQQLLIFEPKGGAARASAADPSSFAKLPVESGDGEVTTFVDAGTGVKMDVGSGFTLEIPPGVDFTNVVCLSITDKRPKDTEVAPGFVRHAQTLELDSEEEALAKQIVLGLTMPKLPEKPGHRFVLAMETSVECSGKTKAKRMSGGGCAKWDFIPAMYDASRGKVIAKLGATGGYRLQFGWLPE